MAKIYDITQELFSCCVFPGDMPPSREQVQSIREGDGCNLTNLALCAHNGTHLDAPFHFYGDGKTVEEIPLEKVIGEARVAEVCGTLSRQDMKDLLKGGPPRLLLKGPAVLTVEAARAITEAGLWLIGVEARTVGDENSPESVRAVHLELLGKEVVILEGLRLSEVPPGEYLLCAQPLKLGGADGAPCRAVLLEKTEDFLSAERENQA